MSHRDVDTDLAHVRDEDVTEVRQITDAQAEVLDLLELLPGGHHGAVRLTLGQWAVVDRVCAHLEQRHGGKR